MKRKSFPKIKNVKRNMHELPKRTSSLTSENKSKPLVIAVLTIAIILLLALVLIFSDQIKGAFAGQATRMSNKWLSSGNLPKQIDSPPDDNLNIYSPKKIILNCGNNKVEFSEECDDGNDIDTDFCTSKCKVNICGDGFFNFNSEGCDDGNLENGDGCSKTCETELKASFCGDGFLQKSEECDDGNDLNDDGCSNACKLKLSDDVNKDECINADDIVTIKKHIESILLILNN